MYGVRGHMKRSTGLLRTMIVFTVMGLLQGLVCMRYIERMSDDRPVTLFYIVVLVVYVVAAAFFYFKWIQERGKETRACTEKK